MKCPHCKLPMIVLELNKVEVDYCTECSGFWLDTGEMELLLESTVKKDLPMVSLRIDLHSTEKKLRCPICRRKMQKALAGLNSDILIDKCHRGHGLWFDRGELQRIVEQECSPTNQEIIDLLTDMFEYKLK
ncbi:MAG: zf-TFIIB domain-containing protein [Bacteroidales bacterium]|nr:zf-TFIIB domain-containing protein [Lentimicrobiaceae bacterium]MDD5694050.1 zf-TFIIB domain-containing protein [Bacteroidales bacterium]